MPTLRRSILEVLLALPPETRRPPGPPRADDDRRRARRESVHPRVAGRRVARRGAVPRQRRGRDVAALGAGLRRRPQGARPSRRRPRDDRRRLARRAVMRTAAAAALLALALLVLALPGGAAAAPAGIHKIRHVIVIMQENRSFDSYFGTYPGRDGIPMQNGARRLRAGPGDRRLRQALPRPGDMNAGGPHERARRRSTTSTAARWTASSRRPSRPARQALQARPAIARLRAAPPADVMGYHDAREIPNYWSYAQQLRAPGPHVRAERVLEPAGAPVPRLRLVGELHAARRSRRAAARRSLGGPYDGPQLDAAPLPARPLYGWTDLTYLLHRPRHLGLLRRRREASRTATDGAVDLLRRQPRSRRRRGSGTRCPTSRRPPGRPGRKHRSDLGSFYAAARTGTLPAVSWIAPNWRRQRASAGARSAPGRRR